MTISQFKIGQKMTNIFGYAKKVLNSDLSIKVKKRLILLILLIPNEPQIESLSNIVDSTRVPITF